MLEGKRILITGGHGFLGSHVVEKLEKGNELILPSRRDFDLTREAEVQRLFERHENIDMVIHMAADIGGIGYSKKHPARQLYHNLLMNVFIQHYAYISGVSKFVGIGSVCEYPAETPVPFVEKELWNGYPVVTNDAYGISKRMMLSQSIAYNREYGFNSIHLLPVNLYGPRDDFNLETSHVIPALIRKIANAKEKGLPAVEVWGTGNESREFIYVEDAAEAVALAAEKYDSVEPVNIGVGKEIKIRELAELLKEIIGYDGHFVYLDNGLGGQMRRMLDITQAKEKFGFLASTSMREGLSKTVEYFYSKFENRSIGLPSGLDAQMPLSS